MTLHPTPHRLVSGASFVPSASSDSPRKVRLVPRAPHPLRLVAVGKGRLPGLALRATAIHQPQPPFFQKLRTPPPASCSCLTSCLRPQESPSPSSRKALRESPSSRPRHTLAQPPPGANGVKCCPRCGLCSFVVALLASAPPLRDHLTPRPTAAKSTYRFCVAAKAVRKTALQNTHTNRGAAKKNAAGYADACSLTNGSRNAVIFSCCERGSSRATSNSFSSFPFGPFRFGFEASRPTITSAEISKTSASLAICSAWTATGLRSQNA